MAQSGRRPVARQYVGSLDGLRALCALGVIGYHMRLSWCGGGLLGVTILFVLSGYLVTAGLMREFRTTRGHISLGGFWVRRIKRLMPTVITFIAVIGAVCTIWNHELLTKMKGDILPAIFMIINWTKIFANESYFAAAGNPSPLTHFWSLAIEAQFYLIFPPIFYFVMRRRVPKKTVRVGLIILTLLSALLMAVLYVPGADPTRSYYGTDTRAMSLLLGCWLAIVWPFDRMSSRKVGKLKSRDRFVTNVVGPLCVAAIIAMMVLTEGYTSFSYYGGILLCSVLTVGAIASLVPNGGWLSVVLGFKPLEWIGKRSYAIYLWHYPILELLNPLNSTTGIPWWKLLLELVLILVVSDLSYRFVEVPMRNFGKKPSGQEKGEGNTDKSGRSGRRRTGSRRSAKEKREFPMLLPGVVVTIVSAAVLAAGLVYVKPVTAAGDDPNEKRVMQAQLKKPLQDGVYDVVLVGDSVSLGANEQLNQEFPHGLIDTKGSRQAPEALEALKGYVDQGVVGYDVVWSIGTNGMLDEELMDELVNLVGKDRTLWLVNVRSPNAKDVDNNALIDKYVAKYDNVKLIDWLGASSGHDDWVGEDGIHLTWAGRDAYANLVVDTMGYVLPDKSNTTYNVMFFGDTVSIDAADKLAATYPKGLIDTAEGRKPEDVAKAFKTYLDQGVVGNTVVVSIGNEEQLKDGDVDAIVQAVGADHDLWLVNVRMPGVWESTNNEILERFANKNENVKIVDWHGASQGHDSWFEEDGFHLTSEGVDGYTECVAKGVKVRDVEVKKDDDEKEEKDKTDETNKGSSDDDSKDGDSEGGSSTASKTSGSSKSDSGGSSKSDSGGSSKSDSGGSSKSDSGSDDEGSGTSGSGTRTASTTRG